MSYTHPISFEVIFRVYLNHRRSSGLFQAVLPLQSFNSTLGIHDSLFTSKVWVALATHLNLEALFRGGSDESVAAETCHLSLGVPLWMDVCSHSDYPRVSGVEKTLARFFPLAAKSNFK